ncbi:MAG: Gfo/Idh/MocA family protein [Gammaproteobacteria bacterium]
MSKDAPMRLRYFEQASNQRHITAPDRYLYARPTPRWRVNIIGTGTIGQEHMRVATLLGRARVNGIFDSQSHSMDVAAQEFASYSDTPLRRFDSLEDACMDNDADALIVCTPNHTHRDVLATAIKGGKPVLLEKPMATTLRDAAAIVADAQQYPQPIHVGLQYRFKAIYAEAEYELLQRRSIGQIHTLNLFEHRPPFLDKVGQWNKFSRCSGGTLIEKCCHYFDLLNRYACALPVSVFARGGQAVNFRDFERDGAASDIMDHAMVFIEYANGVKANFELNMFSPNFHEQLTVVGDDGRLTARESFSPFQEQQTRCDLRVEHDETAPARTTSIAHSKLIEQSGHHGATWFEHAAFLDRLEGKPGKVATPLEGFWSIVVGAAAEESARTGAPVEVAQLLASNDLEHFLGEFT